MARLLDSICPNCNSEFNDIGVLYCCYCGTKLSNTQIYMNNKIDGVIRLVDRVHTNLLFSPKWRQLHRNDIMCLEDAIELLAVLRQ